MNKEIKLTTKEIVLFCFLIFILLSAFLFKNYYIYNGYHYYMVISIFIISLILFTIGMVFFVFKLLKSKKEYEKYIILIVIVYLILNTFVTILINNSFDKGYTRISNNLLSYCDEYKCDRYETIINKNGRTFKLNKIYQDYNGDFNEITINVYYTNKKITKITAAIFSSASLFSSSLIKTNLDAYLKNFNVEINDKNIKEAFEKRHNGKTKEKNKTYAVEEIYENNVIKSYKTTIIIYFDK